MSLVESHTYSLFADFFQFYLQDELVEGDLSDAWGEEATARMLAIAPGVIGVGTVRNMTVPVSLEVHDQEPVQDADGWDHVVECSLRVDSGRIVVSGCTDYFPDAARVLVIPGLYRARVSYGGLTDFSEDKLQGNDHYRVQLWRGASIEPSILK